MKPITFELEVEVVERAVLVFVDRHGSHLRARLSIRASRSGSVNRRRCFFLPRPTSMYRSSPSRTYPLSVLIETPRRLAALFGECRAVDITALPASADEFPSSRGCSG